MSDTKPLEDAVRDLIVDLCEVLYRHGYQEISVGALMKLIGVDSERASEHDRDLLDLQQQFSGKIRQLRNQTVPPGTTLH